MTQDEDLDGIPLADADIDGVPLEKDNIDGVPSELYMHNNNTDALHSLIIK